MHAGLGIRPLYVLWSAIFADFDNDTWPDLFLSAGHIFLRGGPLEDRAALSQSAARLLSRGAASGDFDHDGNLDLLIMNMNEPPSLLKNSNKSGNHWFKVKLRGHSTGATVRIQAAGREQTQVVLSQPGYYSCNDLEITRPNGVAEGWRNLKADQIFLAAEGTALK